MSDVPAVTREKWISQDEQIAVLTADQDILLVQLGRMVHERDAANARAERLAAVLRKARLFVRYSQFSAGYQDENGKSQSYRSEDVQAEIDAALAQQPPPTGGLGAAT